MFPIPPTLPGSFRHVSTDDGAFYRHGGSRPERRSENSTPPPTYHSNYEPDSDFNSMGSDSDDDGDNNDRFDHGCAKHDDFGYFSDGNDVDRRKGRFAVASSAAGPSNRGMARSQRNRAGNARMCAVSVITNYYKHSMPLTPSAGLQCSSCV